MLKFLSKLCKKLSNSEKDNKKTLEELRESKKRLEIAYTELKQLDESKSQFISMASHQLRTPISIARGFTSMFVDGDFGKMSEEQNEYIKKIKENLDRLNTIVNDILNASRIEANRFNLIKEKTNIANLIRVAIEQLSPKAKQKNIPIKVNISKDLNNLNLNIDKDKFFEVIANLIDNAIAYTFSGEINIDYSKNDSNIKIFVKDSGIGIPKNKEDKVFDRFTRLDNAKKVRPDGTGIGLYLAKVIVESHGGKIWFESELEKGTTFFITLPINEKNVN